MGSTREKRSSKAAVSTPHPLSEEQIEATDKRDVALHEAAHAVVAVALGAKSVNAIISENEDRAPDHRTWGGQVQCYTAGLSRTKRAAIGVSGEMAGWYQTLDSEQRATWQVVMWDFLEYLEEAILEPSPTDWEMMGTIWKKRTRSITLLAGTTLSTHWRAVEATAAWLRLEGFIYHDQIQSLLSDAQPTA